ncbi:uncharacterized protein LOC126741314 [Anthonomus grandis grandis]|uniref:uncharacterized protein LOC126741314 n=1 Tax=Anthonomus grandis grandis TaxID=2921223 RepID=UPI0021654472|nr:uncharacterized protein LOC126741314 [Anthonomus grandis grandis]
MDSFYDGPRRAPPLMSTGMLNAEPVVPEISVLVSTNAPRNTFTPYTQWKSQQTQRNFLPTNKENFGYLTNSQQNNSILKKQVRFESPKEQTKVSENSRVTPESKGVKSNENIPSFVKGSYLANLPNKKLDLSVIDLTKSTPPSVKKTESRPRNYKEFLEQQEVDTILPQNVIEDDSITDIFNYKPKSQTNEAKPEATHVERNIDKKVVYKPNKYRERIEVESPLPKETTKTCNCSQKTTSEDDFSAKDLLKIIAQQSQQIAQQNAQLLVLQQQISELVLMQKNQQLAQQNICCSRERYCCPKEDDYCRDRRCDCYRRMGKMRCVTSTRHEEKEQEGVCVDQMNKKHLPNFSIGMTTSFEVAFRNKSAQSQVHQNKTPFVNEKPTVEIEEITETDHQNKSEIQPFSQPKNTIGNKETLVDTSMVFKEPIRVREQCPSPEPSIRINMNDFEESDPEDSSEVEASFYRNLMSQVNKILKKAQIETSEEVMSNLGEPNLNNRTMHKIKEATLKQLRKIGVNLPQMEDSSRESDSEMTNEQSYDQEDISFAVKQLLMKYLPAEHLVRASSNPSMTPERVLTPKSKTGEIKTRPEFSFATVQYMKKYNLITNSKKEFNLPSKEKHGHSPKILDISKLKQQPKLL